MSDVQPERTADDTSPEAYWTHAAAAVRHYAIARQAVTRVERIEALVRAYAALSAAGNALREIPAAERTAEWEARHARCAATAARVAALRREVEAGGRDDLPAL